MYSCFVFYNHQIELCPDRVTLKVLTFGVGGGMGDFKPWKKYLELEITRITCSKARWKIFSRSNVKVMVGMGVVMGHPVYFRNHNSLYYLFNLK